VAEHGLLYDSSLMDDDRPYVLELGARELVELPPHWSLDDWEQYGYLPRPDIGANIESRARVLDLWTNELDGARRYGGLFILTCHPFLSGRPGRVETLRRLIEKALERGDVGFATGEEVAEAAMRDPEVRRSPLRPVEVDVQTYPVL
jgi:peptidoglycan/xylan/chitin deacetylase (PgdA/CDA1 family)